MFPLLLTRTICWTQSRVDVLKGREVYWSGVIVIEYWTLLSLCVFSGLLLVDLCFFFGVDLLVPGFHFIASLLHDGVMIWKRFPHHWAFVRGIYLSPVDSPHKGPVIRGFDISFDVGLNKLLNNNRQQVNWDAIISWNVTVMQWHSLDWHR